MDNARPTNAVNVAVVAALMILSACIGSSITGAALRAQTGHAHQEDDLRFMSVRIKGITERGFTYERLARGSEMEVGEMFTDRGLFEPEELDGRAHLLVAGDLGYVIYCGHCRAALGFRSDQRLLDKPRK